MMILRNLLKSKSNFKKLSLLNVLQKRSSHFTYFPDTVPESEGMYIYYYKEKMPCSLLLLGKHVIYF